MGIYVIVVTYNAMPWIDRCLGSVAEDETVERVVVVDNDSEDGTIGHIRRAYPSVYIMETGRNMGFGQANNIGMSYAMERGADYVYLLNQDAWVESSTLKRLVEIHRRHPHYGLLSPLQTDAEGRFVDKAFVKYKNVRPVLDDLLSGLLLSRSMEVCPIRFVPAAHWFLSAECIRRVGLFSPVFLHYGEDDDYIHRVRHQGLSVGFVPDARAVHARAPRPCHSRQHRVFSFQLELLKHAMNVTRPLAFNLLHLLLYYLQAPFYLLYMTVCQRKGRPVRPYYFHIAPLASAWRELRKNRKQKTNYNSI